MGVFLIGFCWASFRIYSCKLHIWWLCLTAVMLWAVVINSLLSTVSIVVYRKYTYFYRKSTPKRVFLWQIVEPICAERQKYFT